MPTVTTLVAFVVPCTNIKNGLSVNLKEEKIYYKMIYYTLNLS